VTLLFQLREHKYDPDYDPDVSFSQPSPSILRVTLAPSIGVGFVFITLPRAWLNGKYIRWRWSGTYAPEDEWGVYCEIDDGNYQRNSMDDFPNGAWMVEKGSGLLQVLAEKQGSIEEETQDVQIDVSAGVEDECTLFFLLEGSSPTDSGSLNLLWFEINTGEGGAGNLYSEPFEDAFNMEVTGTVYDYGTISEGEVTTLDSDFVDLNSSFHILPHTADLSSSFYVPPHVAELPSNFTVQNFDSVSLSSSFNIQLPAKPLQFSLREHKDNVTYDPDFTFIKQVLTNAMRVDTSELSIGAGYIFLKLPRTWINNKYIRWSWENSVSWEAMVTECTIYDGEYVRSSMTDFPNGSGRATKGNGLLQTLVLKLGNFYEETQDILVDVSAGSEEYCTLFFELQDGWDSQWGLLWLYLFEINTSPAGAGNLYRERFDDAVIMEVTGTVYDYGTISEGEVIGGSGTADLPSFVYIYHPLANLSSSVTIRKAGSKDCSSSFTVRSQGNKAFSASFTLRVDADKALSSNFTVHPHGEVDLPSSFYVQYYSAYLPSMFHIPSARLPSSFTVRHAGTKNLSSSIFVWKLGSKNLSSKFTIYVCAKLPSNFTVRNLSSKTVSSSFRVRSAGLSRLSSNFSIRKVASKALSSSFSIKKPNAAALSSNITVRNIAAVNLSSNAAIRQSASTSLSGSFHVTTSSSKPYSSNFTVRHDTYLDLRSDFHVVRPASAALSSSFQPRHPASKALSSSLIIQASGSAAMSSSFLPRKPNSTPMPSSFTIKQTQSINYPSNITILHPPGLSSSFTVRQSAAVDLGHSIIIRKTTASNLSSSFIVHRPYVDLPSSFSIAINSFARLSSDFTVRNISSANLSSSFGLQKTVNLSSSFTVTEKILAYTEISIFSYVMAEITAYTIIAEISVFLESNAP
jgi:hypothetical protein